MHNQKLVLAAILFLGLALRCYHLDFPSIGYHNMKENEYLSMAEEMLRTNDFVTRRVYFYNAFEKDPVMKIYPQPPLVSYQTLASWKIFGKNLWGPRLFNVFFGVLSILLIYLISLLLFNNAYLALSCALLLAIMPLGVFFSRNLQPESPAFFFMLLGNFFYLRFIRSFKKSDLFSGGLSFSFAWLYKFSFLIGVLPALFCIPCKALYERRKRFFRYLLSFGLPYLIIFFAFLWFKIMGQWEFSELSRVKLFEIFTFSYWEKYGRIIWWYINGENFTFLPFLLCAIGIISAFCKRKELINRYIIGCSLSIIPYSMVFSDFINQHNYYQMPFLGLVCISAIYSLLLVSGWMKGFFKRRAFGILLGFTVLISAAYLYSSAKRMFNTAFLGEDVAGESLKALTLPQERIFLFTFSQGYAIARYAQRYAGGG